MANIKLIKRRIKSSRNISQITRAMEMVAASKMKKAQSTALNNKPYADRIARAVSQLSRNIDRMKYPLFSLGSPKGITLFILVSTNKGLCGALNTNLFRFLIKLIPPVEKLEFISIGKKGTQFIIKMSRNLLADFSDEYPFTKSVPALTELFVKGFINGEYRKVYLVYNNFISVLSQKPVYKKILPIEYLQFPSEEDKESEFREFLLEPDPDRILADLLPHYLENQVRTAIYEAEASEHSARMIAMKNATDAAADLIMDLTLQYNNARQEKITYEIADLVTARMAIS